MDILMKNNISLYTIPAFWLICLSPRSYSMRVYASKTKDRMDNRGPRGFAKKIQDSQQLDATTKGKLIRAEAAIANNFENFGPFAAAVVAANVAKLEPSFVNAVTIAYLGVRAMYNYVYISNDTESKAKVRSALYMVSMGLMLSLFVKAGNRLW